MNIWHDTVETPRTPTSEHRRRQFSMKEACHVEHQSVDDVLGVLDGSDVHDLCAGGRYRSRPADPASHLGIAVASLQMDLMGADSCWVSWKRLSLERMRGGCLRLSTTSSRAAGGRRGRRLTRVQLNRAGPLQTAIDPVDRCYD